MRQILNRRRTFPNRPRRLRAFYGSETAPVTFPTSPLVTRVHIALGADLTASHLTWNWLDITDRVRHDLGIAVTAGRLDERTQVTASRCQLKIENNDGAFCRLNPLSPYFGLLTKNTPIWIELNPGSGFVDTYHGFINEWPARWADESGNDSFVIIQCSGVLRRLAQRTKPTSSTLRRTVLAHDPAGYWPMDDGSSATSFVSAVGGATWFGLRQLGDDDSLPGSASSLPVLDIAHANENIAVPMPPYVDTGRWAAFCCVKPMQASDSDATLWVHTTDGDIYRLSLLNQTQFTLSVYDKATDSVPLIHSTSVPDVTGQWWTMSISSTVGGTLTISLYDTSGNLMGSVTDTNPSSHTAMTSIEIFADLNGAAMGHVVAITDASLDLSAFAVAYSKAAGAFVGEMAHERIRRLCQEDGIPVYCLAAESVAMGAQSSAGLLSLLRECELADQGVLYEHQFGIGYQALSERYNQPVMFSVDFDAGQIAGVPEPSDDDQRLVNLFAATRTGGTLSVTDQVTTGSLGTGPGGSGVYDDSATVNVESDSQLPDYASWRVHLGTVDEDRWPLIPLRMHRSPELIPSWLSTPFGSRINVANPPSQMSPDVIDAVIEGYGERWDEVSWAVALATSPASPYRIFTVGDADLGLIDSGSSSLVAEVSAGSGSLSVATTDAGDLWTTDGADYPLAIQVAGIDVTVTAVSGSTSPQTFTVTGVTKTLPAGFVIELADPTYLGV